MQYKTGHSKIASDRERSMKYGIKEQMKAHRAMGYRGTSRNHPMRINRTLVRQSACDDWVDPQAWAKTNSPFTGVEPLQWLK